MLAVHTKRMRSRKAEPPGNAGKTILARAVPSRAVFFWYTPRGPAPKDEHGPADPRARHQAVPPERRRSPGGPGRPARGDRTRAPLGGTGAHRAGGARAPRGVRDASRRPRGDRPPGEI